METTSNINIVYPSFFSVSSLPIRNGNFFGKFSNRAGFCVSSLPIRNGNLELPPSVKVVVEGFEPTYKEWKLEILQLLLVIMLRGFEPTYKEWKQNLIPHHHFHQHFGLEPTYMEWDAEQYFTVWFLHIFRFAPTSWE